MPVSRAPVFPIFLRIVGAQFAGHGLANGIVDPQTVSIRLHERKRPNSFMRVLRRNFRQHRREQRHSYAAHYRCRFEGSTRLLIGDIGDVQPRKLVHDPLTHGATKLVVASLLRSDAASVRASGWP